MGIVNSRLRRDTKAEQEEPRAVSDNRPCSDRDPDSDPDQCRDNRPTGCHSSTEVHTDCVNLSRSGNGISTHCKDTADTATTNQLPTTNGHPLGKKPGKRNGKCELNKAGEKREERVTAAITTESEMEEREDASVTRAAPCVAAVQAQDTCFTRLRKVKRARRGRVAMAASRSSTTVANSAGAGKRDKSHREKATREAAAAASPVRGGTGRFPPFVVTSECERAGRTGPTAHRARRHAEAPVGLQ